jgi:hypothetical protein
MKALRTIVDVRNPEKKKKLLMERIERPVGISTPGAFASERIDPTCDG